MYYCLHYFKNISTWKFSQKKGASREQAVINYRSAKTHTKREKNGEHKKNNNNN